MTVKLNRHRGEFSTLLVICIIKADISTGNGTHIFFSSEPFSKQDISSEYVMVDFICMVLLDL